MQSSSLSQRRQIIISTNLSMRFKSSSVLYFNKDEQVLYIPVYFAYETEEINEIVQQLKDEHYQATGEQVK
jgi:hypothetical protein